MLRFFYISGLSAILLVTMTQSPVSPHDLDRGGEWLAWSPAERSTFIDGFISGYRNGSNKACLATSDLFEVGKSHRLGDQPAARCSARLESYSKYSYTGWADFTAYTTVITEFYTRHPEYRGIPFAYLLSFLSDRQYKTADQLYQMAVKGELRTEF